MSDAHPTENATALIIGGEVKTVGLAVSGKLFVFSHPQMQFLLNLQKMKNVTAAALGAGRDEAWGNAFLKSRKFREYIACKMQEFSVKNGLTVEWWYQFGKWLSDGYKTYYRIECQECKFNGTMNEYEVETFRNDELEIAISCPVCFKYAVVPTYVREPFTPSREQVEGWKEIGQRLIPKIEKVHHSFDKSDYIFESGGQE